MNICIFITFYYGKTDSYTNTANRTNTNTYK